MPEFSLGCGNGALGSNNSTMKMASKHMLPSKNAPKLNNSPPDFAIDPFFTKCRTERNNDTLPTNPKHIATNCNCNLRQTDVNHCFFQKEILAVKDSVIRYLEASKNSVSVLDDLYRTELRLLYLLEYADLELRRLKRTSTPIFFYICN